MFGFRFSVKSNSNWASVNNMPEAVAIAERWFVVNSNEIITIVDRNGWFNTIVVNDRKSLNAAKSEYPVLVEA
jgi:hypothetical protein